MNSFNLIHNIFKSYSVEAALEMKVKPHLGEMEIETNNDLVDVIVLSKSNSFEFWRRSERSKGYLECACEVSLYCNILKLFVIKVSNGVNKNSKQTQQPISSKPDILFILSEDLQYRLCRVSLEGETEILKSGSLKKVDVELLTDPSQVFISQNAVNSNETSCVIGVQSVSTTLSLIILKENLGEIASIHNCELDKPNSMERIYSIQSSKSVVSSNQAHTLQIVQGDYDESTFMLGHFEIEAPSNNSSSNLKLVSSKPYCFTLDIDNPDIYTIEIFNKGILIFSDSLEVEYFSYIEKRRLKIGKYPAPITSHSFVVLPSNKTEESKVGDQSNNIMLYLATDDTFSSILYLAKVNLEEKFIDFKFLGKIPPATSITILPEDNILLTSVDDDCKVIQVFDAINPDTPDYPYLKTKLSLSNLASIYNMKFLENDFNQRLLITSPMKEKSMSIFQKGMSLSSKGEIQFSMAIKGVKVLFNKYLFVQFESLCLILSQNNESFLVKHTLKQQNLQTFECGKEQSETQDDVACLVTGNGIQLLNLNSGEVIAQEKINRVLISTFHEGNLLLADNENSIISYRVSSSSIIKVPEFKYRASHCISSLSVYKNVLALSLWFQNAVLLIDAVSAQVVQKVEIEESKVVKSLQFYEHNKLLIGFSDGLVSLITVQLLPNNQIVISNQKNMILGYKPIRFVTLKLFSAYCQSISRDSIACVSNEVSVINVIKEGEGGYQRFQKTYLNIHDVNGIDEISIDGNVYLISAKGKNLTINNMKVSQKYHIHPFGKDVQQQNEQRCKTELVEIVKGLCISVSITEGKEENVINSNILLHSIKNQELLDSASLPQKCVYSLLSIDDFFVVAGQNVNDSTNSNFGFMFIFVVDNESKMQIVEKVEFKMPIMHLSRYNKDQMVLIIGHEAIRIYQFPQTTYQAYCQVQRQSQPTTTLNSKGPSSAKFLVEVISQTDQNIVALSLDSNSKNQVLVADRMRGIQLFQEHNKKLTISAKSAFPVFATNSKFLGEDNILFCDKDSNLLVFRQNELAETDLERIRLLVVSSINNGDIIQTSLKRSVPIKNVKDKYLSGKELDQVIYGTKKGWVGVIMSLNEQANTILQDLQESILQRHKCPLKFDYESWKAIRSIPCSKQDRSKFIDGDIIFKVLKMQPSQLVQVIDGMSAIPKPSISEIEQLIENLDLLLF